MLAASLKENTFLNVERLRISRVVKYLRIWPIKTGIAKTCLRENILCFFIHLFLPVHSILLPGV